MLPFLELLTLEEDTFTEMTLLKETKEKLNLLKLSSDRSKSCADEDLTTTANTLNVLETKKVNLKADIEEAYNNLTNLERTDIEKLEERSILNEELVSLSKSLESIKEEFYITEMSEEDIIGKTMRVNHEVSSLNIANQSLVEQIENKTLQIESLEQGILVKLILSLL